MRRLLAPLRNRLAIGAFAAIYVPVLLALLSTLLLSDETTTGDNGTTVIERGVDYSPWMLLIAAAFIPVAAGLAWIWSGRAIRPIERAIAIQNHLIEETSHELRTPLTILTTNADVILTHPEPTDDLYRAGLEQSLTTARRMTQTLETLLVDARGQARSLDRQATDLHELAIMVCAALQPLAQTANVTIQPPTGRPIKAPIDPESVERAISNMIRNGIQHAPTGSTVSVEVSSGNGSSIISVTDQGPGIEAEDQSRIFDRYWHDGDGTGIGLAIVKQVAIAHGGTATVTSPTQSGRGSRFELTLKT